MSIIDMHTHFSVETSRFSEDADVIGYAVENKSLGEHLDMMNELGISWSLLSCPTLKYLDQRERCASYCREVNDAASAVCVQHPDRFGFAALLPLPHIADALSELRRAAALPGMHAVGLCSNYLGMYLGDSRLEPLFDLMDELALTAVLHPAAPPVYPAAPVTGKVLPMFEFIVDTTRTMLDLFAAETLLRHPNIRLVIPHTGSCLPVAYDRFHGILRVQNRDVEVPMDQLYFDLACDAYPRAVPSLLNLTDTKHIVYGSDFPAIPLPVLRRHVDMIRNCPEFRDCLDDILCNNAHELLRRDRSGDRHSSVCC